MNVFDIIVYIALAWGVFNGWRRGFLLQMLSLLAIVAALYFAVQYGSQLEQILGMEVGIPGIVGFIVIFLGALIVTTIAGYMLRAVFRFAGLGMVDVLLGIILSVVKVALIISVLFSWFASINKNYDLVPKKTIEKSICFKAVTGFTDKFTPYFEEMNFEELKDNLLKK
ncbi:MAG: CvpA family protein [Alistipes sp.]|nr:CvpA family protein [Alistipes sp.]